MAVLGIVYGDIGTSPLYAFKASLQLFDPARTTQVEIMGVLSLIFWSLIIIVTLKYVFLVMRGDNRGEGGILALMALAQRVSVGRHVKNGLALVGIAGACLFFGDGVITPAISVLSAVEGLEVSAPELEFYVLPISVAVIVALFTMQYHGTGGVGRVFGPVMVVWFFIIGADRADRDRAASVRAAGGLADLCDGALRRIQGAGVFRAGRRGAVRHRRRGAVCRHGAFRRAADPDHLADLRAAVPDAELFRPGRADDPRSVRRSRTRSSCWARPGLRLPMVLLATAATVIASQAVISGAFSMARQCMQLGFLPRMTVRHTSNIEEGQIYVPQVNTALAVGVVLLVLAFKTSDNLASAYGIAVTGTFLCTAILAMVVFRRQFHWSRACGDLGVRRAVPGRHGVLFRQHGEDRRGRLGAAGVGPGADRHDDVVEARAGLLLSRWKQSSMPLAPFLARLPQSRIIRVPGLAVFMTSNPDYVPTSLLHNLKHNKVLHDNVLFVTVENEAAGENQNG